MLLVVYAVGSFAVVVPLLLDLPGSGELAGTTSGKILAAAIFALGFGAAMAARDPWRDRLMIQVLIAFAAAATVLLTVFYPRAPQE